MSLSCIQKIDTRYLKRNSSSSATFILANILFFFPGVLTASGRTFGFSSQKKDTWSLGVSNHRLVKLEKSSRGLAGLSLAQALVCLRETLTEETPCQWGGFWPSYVVWISSALFWVCYEAMWMKRAQAWGQPALGEILVLTISGKTSF